MTTDELRVLISSAGYLCRVNKDEVVLQTCYFCGNAKYNLECAPEKGVYYCWACQQGGRLSTLIRALTGQHVHITVQPGAQKKSVAPAVTQDFQSMPVVESVSASNYLTMRGMAPDVAMRYGLVVCTDEAHPLFTRICIPVKDWWSGERSGWVGRSYTTRRPKYLSTVPTKHITGWRMKDAFTPIVVVEGPLDGIFVHSAGYQSAVLAGRDSGQVVAEWSGRIKASTPLVLMLDGDAVSQQRRLFRQLAAMFRPVYQVQLHDGEDPANVGLDRVRALVAQALPQ